jgi:hypothetical protein
MTRSRPSILTWVVAPLALAVASGVAGRALGRRAAGAARRAAAPSTPRALEAAPALAVANLVWAFGTADAVKAISRTELDRLPASEGRQRARALMRFGSVDDNLDGQAAVFGQACVADQDLCSSPAQLRRAVEAELRTRFVSPNVLPSYIVGHPGRQ